MTRHPEKNKFLRPHPFHIFQPSIVDKFIIIVFALHIRNSNYKRDEICLFLYVWENGDDFKIYFPSSAHRDYFRGLVVEMTKNQEQPIIDLDLDRGFDRQKVKYLAFDFTTSQAMILYK